MARYDTGERYDSGIRYSDPDPEPLPPEEMKAIKLELGRKTIDQKVAQGNAIKTGMTGNANFPTPPLTMTAFGADISDLAAKKLARDNIVEASKAATEALHAAEKVYDAAVTQLGAYAEGAVAGDAVKLEGAGFTLRKTPQPIPGLEQVQGLRLTSNTFEGKLFARWEKLYGAKSYEAQITTTPDNESSWRSLTPCPAAKTVIEDLTSGTKVWLRVRGVAKKITGPWSQLAWKTVP